jgi:hypothetical protein
VKNGFWALIVKLKDGVTPFRKLDKKVYVTLKRRVYQLLFKGENEMGDRIKIFGIVALLGFLAGILAQLTADYAIPWLMDVLPAIVQIKFVVSGFAGACLTIVMVSVWAYMSGQRDR